MHHCLRNAGPGYGQSLGEALVSEGLAGQFVNRLYGTPPEPWEKAVAPTRRLALPAGRQGARLADVRPQRVVLRHRRSYPRWLGYTLGYLLAGRWRALEPEANGARLVNVTAAEVIAAARSFS